MIYVAEFERFVKVGKSRKPHSRIENLSHEYKEDVLRFWISSKIDSYDFAESMAHKMLEDCLIKGEKFSCSFEHAVKTCMTAISRSENPEPAGFIGGIKVFVDSGSGYIDATSFKKESDYGIGLSQFLRSESVKNLGVEIKAKSGMSAYYTCRGRSAKTFVHPYVFIELLRNMSAELKVQVYMWALNEMPQVKSICECIEKTKNKGN